MVHLKMPIRSSESSVEDDDFLHSFRSSFWSKATYLFRVDPTVVPVESDYYTCAFNRTREDIFKIESKDSFFSSAQRSGLTYDILARAPYEEENRDHKIGIEQLLNKGVYSAAFPLHDGQPYLEEETFLTLQHKSISIPDRQRLYYSWGSFTKFYKFQPLHLIRGYFGEKIAIYFAWLGFYTSFLLPVALGGVAVFIYGVATVADDVPTAEVCDADGRIGEKIMCPQCRDKHCNYWRLCMSCAYMRVTYLVDNKVTVAFAFAMCIWSVFFLEFWKRRQATLAFDWDLNDELKEESGAEVRPDFEAKCTRKKKNPVTGIEEPYFPTVARLPRYLSGLIVALVAVCCVLIAVIGVIAYRVSMRSFVWKKNWTFGIDIGSKVFISVTSATINLICIMVLSRVYAWVALRLTMLENQRTDEDYENSYTLKMYCFQFVNYYSSIFYIAFFKGRFYKFFDNADSHGRESPAKYDECDPAGCLIELFIQMAIIMVGKQIYSNIQEFLMPRIWKWWRKRVIRRNEVEAETEEEEMRQRRFRPQWENDYHLTAIGDLGLFYEYLEMVIQFGFVTLFVVAFPLAPAFALINNLIEIKLDANKFTCSLRRQRPMRAKDIGVWTNILGSISRFAVITNALVIAFTSNFIERIFYALARSPDGSLHGFNNFTLSRFNTSDFTDVTRPKSPENFVSCSYSSSSAAAAANSSAAAPSVCFYRDFRDSSYSRTATWFHIMLAKVVFVLVFEHVVYFARDLVIWLVPDVPSQVRVNVRREAYLGKKALYDKELERTKELRRRKTVEE